MKIKKLSKQTIKELAELTSHFDCGVEILVNNDENEIQIVGVDLLDDDRIQIRRCYEFDFGTINTPEGKGWIDDSEVMFDQILKDDELLKASKLDQHLEVTKQIIEDMREGK